MSTDEVAAPATRDGPYADALRELLTSVAEGSVAVADAVESLRRLPFSDLGFARVDHHRSLRQGVETIWRERSGLLAIPRAVPEARGRLLVLTAGTSDLPVAEEAETVATLIGAGVRVVADVGVAGLHRLLAELPEIEQADAIVVVAGMDAALASVVGGLARVPVIACPTSVGYGSTFGGLSALLAMISSCAPGVAVVGVDDGVGAGAVGALIARGRLA